MTVSASPAAPARPDRSPIVGPRTRRRLGLWGTRFGLAVFVVLALGPIAWGVVTSLLPTNALTQSPPNLSPANLTLSNYIEVLTTRGNLVDALVDSAIVATLTASISLVLGITWDEIDAALRELPAFVKRENLWYSVANDLVVGDRELALAREALVF